MKRSVAIPSESSIRPKTDNNVNFINYCNSTVPVDVVRVKSYVDNLLNSTRVPVRSS